VPEPLLKPEALGALLRTFREAIGLSQEALAARAGFHRTYISHMERGSRKVSFDSLQRYLAACDVEWTEFSEAIQSLSAS